ncbi:single-stranded DNA-binding protein [Enterococcus termitis]|nr:single-stranded DNA-binding protein [Enterococcus termitis]
MISNIHAPKDKQNEFGNFSYRDAEGILKAAKAPAIEQGLYIKVTKEVVKIEDRFYIKATASITDGTKTEEAVGYAREPQTKPKMDESQVTGSASSYAKKYALSDLLMIDDGKDDPDKGNNTMNQNNINANNTKIDGRQLAELNNEARKIAEICSVEPSVFTTKIAEMGKVPDLSELPGIFYQEALATLVKWKQDYQKKQQNNQQNNQSIPWGKKQ